MISELTPDALQAISPLFHTPYMEFAVNALAAGNSYARVWVDTPANPASAFLWEGPRFYFTGRTDNIAFNEAVGRVITTLIKPAPGAYLVIYYDSASWVAQFPGIFADRQLHPGQRCFYRLDSQGVPDWRARVPASFSIVPIDRQLLAATAIVNLGEVIGEINSTWPDERFLEHGFGFCALRNENEIVCWCTGEYAGGRHIGVGIETVGEWRRKGLATLTASAFVEHCLSNGIEAHWDCWADNLPSLQVAERVGFRKVLDYSVYEG